MPPDRSSVRPRLDGLRTGPYDARVTQSSPILAVFAFLLVSLAGLRPLLAHDPPPLWFETRLEDGRFIAKIHVMAPLLDQWLGIERADVKVLGEGDEALIRERMTRWFGDRAFFKADDVVINAVVGAISTEKVEYHEFTINYIAVTLEFPVAAPPKTMTFEWRKEDFDIFHTWPMVAFDLELGYLDDLNVIRLDVDEPRFVWHAPPRAAPARVLPPPPAPRRVAVPVLSVALAVGFLVFLPLSFLLGLRRRLRWSVCALLLLASAASAGVMKREMRPFWAGSPEAITESRALEIFEALHQNTYNAFRFEDESTIYDTLARSVDGDLLQRLYDEVYESLIMREEGGVVCRVIKVTIEKETLELPEDPDRREFAVDATWTVRGRVGHFGHEHVRVLRYSAHFVLRETEKGWRIVDVEVRDQRRLEPDEDGGS